MASSPPAARARTPSWPLRILSGIAALLLACAFAFFGWFKSFAPRAVLDQHHAWTTALPDPIGRAVGFSELAAALVLLVMIVRPGRRGLALGVAGYTLANQGCAAIVHLMRGESGALPQNAVLAGLALLAALAALRRPESGDRPKGNG